MYFLARWNGGYNLLARSGTTHLSNRSMAEVLLSAHPFFWFPSAQTFPTTAKLGAFPYPSRNPSSLSLPSLPPKITNPSPSHVPSRLPSRCSVTFTRSLLPSSFPVPLPRRFRGPRLPRDAPCISKNACGFDPVEFLKLIS